MNRREIMSLGVLLSSTAGVMPRPLQAMDSHGTNLVDRQLDEFISTYRDAMNAPALTLGLADSSGPIRATVYGYSDVEAKAWANTTQLFQIGSLSKSFIAIVTLQLCEAGRLDLHASIRKYLPWLQMESEFGEISAHHLLTHSSGMPADAAVIPNRPDAIARQAYAPGSKFHYCNWGFEVLGHLIEKIEDRPWPGVLRDRILTPLGMARSAPVVTSEVRARMIRSYVALYDDRPYTRHGPIAPAGNLTVTTAAGSIASTADDMAQYLQMLLNRGRTPHRRLISDESFQLLTSPHIDAPMFGPSTSYGYGIAIDRLDGRKRLKHTGGSASFSSSLQVDLDGGFGAFACVNAQLGYRPAQVADYALRVLFSRKAHQSAPIRPALDDPTQVINAMDYQGLFTRSDGRQIEIKADNQKLVLSANGRAAPLQRLDGDEFVATHPDFLIFPVIFSRSAETTATTNDKALPVTSLSYGPDWYAGTNPGGESAVPRSSALDRYVGTYYVENPWYDTARIVQRQGQLWLGGNTALVQVGEHRFRVGTDETSPETAVFATFVDDKARWLRLGGAEFRRIPEDAT
jgi:D-alanyl-D-alanine carboxypeptidase